ncbi:MAG: hypothetical protein CBC67_01310 [Gammaproteobacteria bacterium TMED107]|nr:hypothetical protein [Gammaproteobacteria bacterium]OUX77175.1 MAG: hypothetical protein CBC67_01310 [Gammaproteobacteria bacterium TMED107]
MQLLCVIQLQQIAVNSHQHVQVSEVGEHGVATSLHSLSQEECTEELSQKPEVAVVTNAAMENAPGSPTAT